jgi:hypothetical protein
MSEIESFKLPKHQNANFPTLWKFDYGLASEGRRDDKVSSSLPPAESLLPIAFQRPQDISENAWEKMIEMDKRLADSMNKNTGAFIFFGYKIQKLFEAKGIQEYQTSTTNEPLIDTDAILLELATHEVLMSRYCATPDGLTENDINRDTLIMKQGGVSEKEIQDILDDAREKGVPQSCLS